MAIYLKLDPIKGSVTDTAFKDQIELTSFQWGAGLAVASARGGDRTTSEPSVSEISGTKALDKSSPGLFKQLLLGKPITKGTVSFTAASNGTSVAYLTIDLEEVLVSAYSQSSGGGNDIPTEAISLNFSKFTSSFTARDAKQGTQPMRIGYDLATNDVS